MEKPAEPSLNEFKNDGTGDSGIQSSMPTFNQADLYRVQRKLSRTQIQMITIAGMIGTGLFLGLGQILAETGPLGMLLVFLHVGSVEYSTLTSIAEMTSFAPVAGSFPHYAERWVDPALGFAVGWNYFYNCAITVPAEITASSVLVSYFDHNKNHTAIYIAVFCVATVGVNLLGVRFFGNSEIIFSTLKISLIIGMIIGGIVVTAGGGPDHTSHGFEYWRNPGPIVSFLEPGARGRFIGMLAAVIPAAFAMNGVEVIAVTSAEAVNPRRNIATAMKTVFFRILVFYILSVFIVGLLVPSNDPKLFQKAATAGQSPFVLAFSRAGIRVLPSIINAVILTSAFSSGSGILFIASRVLYGLAIRGQAPRFLKRCTKSGLPYAAILVSGSVTTLAFLNVNEKAGRVFGWLASLSAVGGLLGSATINLTYLRYYRGLKLQKIVPEGIYRSKLQPYTAIWGLFWITCYLLISGISVFWSFNASDFVAAYINLPLFGLLYVGWKIVKKTKIIPLEDLDYTTGIPSFDETEAYDDDSKL